MTPAFNTPVTLEQVNQSSPVGALQLLDGLYEHCPWVAEQALTQRPFRSLAHLKHVLTTVLTNADVAAGLTRHAGIWAVMGFSTEFWKQEVWRALEFESKEAFLAGFLEPYFTAMDPNDLLCMAWKWQRGDVARHTGGDLAAALGRITATTFVLPISEDMFFPVRDHEAEQAHIANSELRVVDDVLGHLGLFGVAPTFMQQIDRHLGELLAR